MSVSKRLMGGVVRVNAPQFGQTDASRLIVAAHRGQATTVASLMPSF